MCLAGDSLRAFTTFRCVRYACIPDQGIVVHRCGSGKGVVIGTDVR